MGVAWPARSWQYTFASMGVASSNARRQKQFVETVSAAHCENPTRQFTFHRSPQKNCWRERGTEGFVDCAESISRLESYSTLEMNH